MRLLSVILVFLLVLTSLPVSAASLEGSGPSEASAGTPAATASATPAPEPSPATQQPTLHEMLAQTTRADFAAGDRPTTAAVTTLAPGQEAPAEAKEKKSHKTLWIVLGCVAGAAIIWAIADSGGDSNGSGGGGGGY